MQKLFGAVKAAAKDFSDDECMVSGAAIAYYTIFAFPPILVIVFFVAGMFGVSQQKIDQVVKEQLGMPTTAVTGQQQQSGSSSGAEAGSPAERSARLASRAGESPAQHESAAVGTPPPASILTGLAASIAAADPKPQPPPLPEGAGVAPARGHSRGAGSDMPVSAPKPADSHKPSPPPAASSDRHVSGHGEAPRGVAAGPADRPVAGPPQEQPDATRQRSSQAGQQGGGTQSQGQSSQGQSSQGQSSQGQSSQGQSPEDSGGLGTVASRAQSQSSPLSGLGPISKIVGILVLVFSATGVFAQLQHALNRAWEVEPDPEQSGIWTFLFKRLLSLGMVAVLAFLLLVSLVLTTLVDEIAGLVTGGSSGVIATVIGVILNNLATLAVATLLFAAMFKLLPDARMRWKDTWVGAFITALLFVIGKNLLSLYLQNSDIGSTWGGAAASMIALLVWVYYSSLIVLFGAELAQVWANRYGHGIEPAKGAVRIVEEKRHLRGSAA